MLRLQQDRLPSRIWGPFFVLLLGWSKRWAHLEPKVDWIKLLNLLHCQELYPVNTIKHLIVYNIYSIALDIVSTAIYRIYLCYTQSNVWPSRSWADVWVLARKVGTVYARIAIFNWEKYKKKVKFWSNCLIFTQITPSDSLKDTGDFFPVWPVHVETKSLDFSRGNDAEEQSSAVEQYSKPWLVDDWGIGVILTKSDQYWLVVWNMFYDFPYIGNLIIPSDFHSIILQRGRLNHQPEYY